MRAGIVPMEKDVHLSFQRDGHFSATDGTGTNKCVEEVWQLGDVLRGRRGDCDTYPGRPHRATGLGVCIYEKGRIKM